MSRVRLISAQYIKDNSIVNDNVDNKYLNTAIDLAMDKNLRTLIGTEFYDDLITKATTANGDVSLLPEAYRNLIQKQEFKDFLLWSVIANGILYMVYKVQNKGIGKKSSDNAQPVENYDLDKLTDEAKNNSEFYGERVLYYLNKNSSSYPLINACGDINSPETAYKSPVFTGLKRPTGRRFNPNTRYGR